MTLFNIAVICAILQIGVIGLLILNRRALKGSREKYLIKTSLIAAIVLCIVAEIVNMAMRVYYAKEALEKGFAILVCALFCAVFGDILYRLIKQDDDNWFNNQWGKLKRWVKNARQVRRLKPAYAR